MLVPIEDREGSSVDPAEGGSLADPVRFYWLPWSRVYHVVLGGRLCMCGLMVKPGRDGHRNVWRLTTYRPLGHRVCYRCLYARETWPWMMRRL